MRYKSRTRALASAALAASLGLAGLAFTASPVQASETTDVVRVAGTTRYGTAADAATSAYPAGSANVVLASGEKFPDALAGGGLAGSLDAPVLLTLEDSLPADTIAALAELGAETVTILGGTAAVSAAVEAELVALGYATDRVAGADRFETAADIAAELGGTTAVLANGLRFPDALAISPGAHALELPVLLTLADSLHEDAAAYIDANAVDTVIIVGGTAVVSQDIEDALAADGITVVRLAGDTRYESSVEIAEFHVTQGFTLDEVAMATGEDFADALAGGPYAAQMGAPMVLTQTAALTPATAAFLTENCLAIDALSILGGTAAITTEVEAAAAAAAQCATNATFGVDEAGEQLIDLDDPTANPVRAYTFSGLTPGDDYDVALFECQDIYNDEFQTVVVDEGLDPFINKNGEAERGVFRFRNQDANDEADNGASTAVGNADILTVGFTPVNADFAYDVTATSTELLVRVGSTGPDCTFPVLWSEPTDEDDALNVDENSLFSAPAEPFQIGGPTLWHNDEADVGDTADNTVLWVDLDDNFFVEDVGDVYFYSEDDQFQYEDASGNLFLTIEQWEQALSMGDDIYTDSDEDPDYDYKEGPGGITTWEHEDGDVPGIVENVTVQETDTDDDGAADDLLITWSLPDPAMSLPGEFCATAWDDPDDLAGATTTSLGCTTPEVNTIPGSSATSLEVENHTLAGGEYVVTVQVDSIEDTTGDHSQPSAAVTIEGPAGPTIVSADLTNDAITIGAIDADDEWTLVFSADLDTVDDGDQIWVTDEDGDQIRLEDDSATDGLAGTGTTEADFSLTGDTLVVTIVGTPVDIDAAGDGEFTYPATVVATAGVTAGGVEADLDNSTDLVID